MKVLRIRGQDQKAVHDIAVIPERLQTLASAHRFRQIDTYCRVGHGNGNKECCEKRDIGRHEPRDMTAFERRHGGLMEISMLMCEADMREVTDIPKFCSKRHRLPVEHANRRALALKAEEQFKNVGRVRAR